MQLGDFTHLANHYKHRPSYSPTVTRLLAQYVGSHREGFTFADIGAGTGKMTECLVALGLKGYAVEPNDPMRHEGQISLGTRARVEWLKGSGENTGLSDSSVDWVIMASSFHWTNPALSLPEFHRVLKPGGYFTVIYNPRDVQSEGLHKDIDDEIRKRIPHLKRTSSGSSLYTQNLEKTLVGEYFQDPVFVEAPYSISMTQERFLGVWKSVNDIQAQAGPEVFAELIRFIETKTASLAQIECPYRIRSWTVQATPKATA